jgi:DNA-directed RNA polymerase subunit alpha
MNIVTLGDLARISETELLSYKNFGETSLREIRQIMELKGLKLGVASLDGKTREINDEEDGVEDEQTNDLLDKSISELELSVRAKKALENLGVLTVGQLVAKTEDELLKCKNFGVTSLNEIKQALTNVGLELYSEEEYDDADNDEDLDEQEEIQEQAE